MKSKQELESDLSQFHGTEQYHGYRALGSPMLKLTDGVFYLVKEAQCCWLMDIIGSIFKKLRALDSFHVITLTRKGRGATFVADDGNGNIHYKQEVEFTDFPLDSIKLYFQDDVVMLCSEY